MNPKWNEMRQLSHFPRERATKRNHSILLIYFIESVARNDLSPVRQNIILSSRRSTNRSRKVGANGEQPQFFFGRRCAER